jgi:hypothetical protein
MTILSMCQQVAREVGVQVPSTVINNNDTTVAIFLAMAQNEGKTLSKGKIPSMLGRHNWTALIKEFTFNTANNTPSYLLSTFVGADFDRFINDTFWNRSSHRKMTLYTPQEWQLVKSGIVAQVGIEQKWRIKQKAIFIHPTPTDIEIIAGEYLSNRWCQSSGGTAQSFWNADTDTGILDEDLMVKGIKWRYLRKIGEPYFDELEEYNAEVLAAQSGDGGRTNTPKPPVFFGFNIPESGYGA